jgi:hypothetical protein
LLEGSLALLVILHVSFLKLEELLARLDVFEDRLATLLDQLRSVLVLLLYSFELFLKVMTQHFNVLFGQLQFLLPFFLHGRNLFFELFTLDASLENQMKLTLNFSHFWIFKKSSWTLLIFSGSRGSAVSYR